MNHTITVVSITAAALIMQFSVILIMFAAAFIMRIGMRYSPFWREGRDTARYLWFLIGFSLFTLGTLLLSSEFSATWAPLFGGTGIPGIPWSVSLATVFVANIICISVLCGATGGSTTSPFAPIYFVVPPLAIFLRSSLGQVILFFLLSSLLFSVGLRGSPTNEADASETRAKLASWLVAIACFALATLVGYITRPL